MIDVQAYAPWVSILIALFALWLAHSKDKSKETDVRIGALAGKIDLVEDRVTRVESDLQHLPDKDTTHRLELALSDMRTELRGVSEGMKPIKSMVDRVHEVLLDKVKVAS